MWSNCFSRFYKYFVYVSFICGKVYTVFQDPLLGQKILENIDECVKLKFKSKFPNETLPRHTEVCGMMELNLPNILPGVNTSRELLLVWKNLDFGPKIFPLSL